MFKKVLPYVAMVSAAICVLSVIWLQLNPPMTLYVKRIPDAIDDVDGTNPKYEISTAPKSELQTSPASDLYVLDDKLSSQRNLAFAAQYRIGSTSAQMDAMEDAIRSACEQATGCNILPITRSTRQRQRHDGVIYLLMPTANMAAWVAELEQESIPFRKKDAVIYKHPGGGPPDPQKVTDQLNRLARIQAEIHKVEPRLEPRDMAQLDETKAKLAQQFDLLTYAQNPSLAVVEMTIDPSSSGTPVRAGGQVEPVPIFGLIIISIMLVIVIAIPIWVYRALRRRFRGPAPGDS